MYILMHPYNIRIKLHENYLYLYDIDNSIYIDVGQLAYIHIGIHIANKS